MNLKTSYKGMKIETKPNPPSIAMPRNEDYVLLGVRKKAFPNKKGVLGAENEELRIEENFQAEIIGEGQKFSPIKPAETRNNPILLKGASDFDTGVMHKGKNVKL